jgi:hypothetical protein
MAHRRTANASTIGLLALVFMALVSNLVIITPYNYVKLVLCIVHGNEKLRYLQANDYFQGTKVAIVSGSARHYWDAKRAGIT